MSVLNLFTEMHLRSTVELIAGHERLVREMAERAGLDADRAWAEAQVPTVEMTCPACGQPATMALLCRGCGGGAFSDYAEVELTAARQRILGLLVGSPQARQHAADHAFGPGGCMVCPDCIEQTLTNSDICPLLWILSPRSGLTHLTLIQMQGEDPDDEYRLIFEMWADTLADGEAAEWRVCLFEQAIPEAFRALSECYEEREVVSV